MACRFGASRLLIGFCLMLSCGVLLAQRADRGIITGVVSDPTGSPTPSANITIRNEGTGVETRLTSNEAGASAGHAGWARHLC